MGYELAIGSKKVRHCSTLLSHTYSLFLSQQRQSSRVKPAVVVYIGSLVFPTSLVVSGYSEYIIAILIQGYIGIVTYSLWAKLKDEEKNALNGNDMGNENMSPSVAIDLDLLSPSEPANNITPDSNQSQQSLPFYTKKY